MSSIKLKWILPLMGRFLLLPLIGGVMLTASPGVLAQEGVAVVSVEFAVQQTDYFQQQLKVLQQDDDYKELEEEGNDKLEDLRELQEKAGREAATMTEKQLASMQGRITEKANDLKLIQSKLEARQKNLWENTLVDLRDHIQKAVQEVIKARGIKVLVNRQAVLYADELIDITDDVAKVINRLKLNAGNEENEDG